MHDEQITGVGDGNDGGDVVGRSPSLVAPIALEENHASDVPGLDVGQDPLAHQSDGELAVDARVQDAQQFGGLVLGDLQDEQARGAGTGRSNRGAGVSRRSGGGGGEGHGRDGFVNAIATENGTRACVVRGSGRVGMADRGFKKWRERIVSMTRVVGMTRQYTDEYDKNRDSDLFTVVYEIGIQ